MRKQTGLLIGAALVLAALYAFKFTDWFGKKHIQILFTTRNAKAVFGLDGKEYQLNSVKVFRVAELATNKYPHAVWNLVATNEKGSSPTTAFSYGATIEGMKPAVPGTKAERLESLVNYRIIVESGKIKGEREFQLR